MKAYFLTVLSCLALLHGISAQADKQMKKIDKTVLRIRNNIPNLQKVDSNKDSVSYRNVYAKDKELQMINIYFKDKTIDKNVEWYFSDGHMIYAEQMWTDRTTKNVVNKQRAYLAPGHLIALIKSGDIAVDTTSQEFKNYAPQIVAYGEKLESDYANKMKKNNK